MNAVDLRDQVGSYRVIVSYETELLEAFSLCILQQHNCFNCDAKIIADPVADPDSLAIKEQAVGRLGEL